MYLGDPNTTVRPRGRASVRPRGVGLQLSSTCTGDNTGHTYSIMSVITPMAYGIKLKGDSIAQAQTYKKFTSKGRRASAKYALNTPLNKYETCK